jgi:glycosyltransferase involved in cell wall biosynthesis
VYYEDFADNYLLDHYRITARYAKLFNIPTLTRYRAYAEKAFKEPFKIVALSKVEAEQYRRVGVPEAKIAIMPNRIDLLVKAYAARARDLAKAIPAIIFNYELREEFSRNCLKAVKSVVHALKRNWQSFMYL